MEGGFGGLVIRQAFATADWAARALFPHFCAGCGREGRSVCHECQAKVEAPRAGLFVCPGCGAATAPGARCGAATCGASLLDGLASIAPYEDVALQRLLQEYKYARVEAAGTALARVFAATVRARSAEFGVIAHDALIVPVPLHPLRQAARGFNQAETLARVFARETGRPVAVRLLRRVHGGRAQATLDDAAARAANAVGKFAARLRFHPGARFVLVDDVYTTGATMGDAARALKAAGAGEVCAVTLLRKR